MEKSLGDILKLTVGPKISAAIIRARGNNKSNRITVNACVEEPFTELIERAPGGPETIAAWYKFFANEDNDELLDIPDGTRYFIDDCLYQGKGVFGVSLRKLSSDVEAYRAK